MNGYNPSLRCRLMKIKDGSIILYYSFDIASEIQLDKLEKVFGKKPAEAQIVYTKLTPKYIKYAQPPYIIRMGEKQISIGDQKFNFKVSAKLYDFGVINVKLVAPFSGHINELVKISDKLVEISDAESEAKKVADKIKKEIADVLVKPIENHYMEDYIIFHVKEFDKKTTAKELVEKHRSTLASILRSEAEELDESEINGALNDSVSYFSDDIVIVDWNAAFVYDSREAFDTFDVLEYANIELLELRTYDSILDKEIDSAYDRIAAVRSRPIFFWPLEPFGPTLKRLEETRFDVTQIVEKVENALKLVGDPYLARVYTAASTSFHLGEWKSSIKGKLDIVEDFYETLIGRIQSGRSTVLEILIVALFLFEIALYFFPAK